ncbi:MAG: 3-phosphoshikimate 1-carboxyvinyltransferase [Verrucomicrobiota bacterium]|nr:3-phosphoshikimate 1-carboxyvinyltransferase [Verrucomicrobiota bacterium]
MSLPSLIEILPISAPVAAEITTPGSKSITNRALVLAALASGRITLEGALWSEDTQVMVECLKQLGFEIQLADDPLESCNRQITVTGLGGVIPRSGSPERPLELFVGNAGTAARFLSALLCLGQGSYRLHGVARMHERPQAALFKALRELGYRIDSENERLPAVIHGKGATGGSCSVAIEESSQFASALLLCAEHGGWNIRVTGEDAEESPYVTMTSQLLDRFPRRGGSFQIEPDASSASYFWGAGWLLKQTAATVGSKITVHNWPKEFLQVDTHFPVRIFELPGRLSRRDQLGDSIMTAIVLAPFATGVSTFTDLGRLRLQECERVHALKTELSKCGAVIEERGDTLEVHPSPLHGAEIETYHDHRMAMCFATLGLNVPGIRLKNPACVKKTFPNFFQKLAAATPHGLGVGILDKDGNRLELNQLFAD